MSQTTQCPNCGVVLNLPDNAAGKKLKCPRCNTRFSADSTAAPRPESKAPSSGTTSPTSSLTLTTREDEPDIPIAEGDLRETFAPDLLMGEATPSGGATGGEADASTLFREPPPRKAPTTGAEARAKPRRCPNCSSVVPAGMSLCARCGLDLETGQRHHLEEIFEEPPPPPRRSGMPLPIFIIGGIMLMVSLTLALLALVESQGEDTRRWMTLSLAFVGFFGLYASIQFLRLKALKPMITALVLGAILDVGVLIAYPIINASRGPVIKDQWNFQPAIPEEMPTFTSREERLRAELWKINWGIAILLIDSGLIVYLLTSGIQRQFTGRRSQTTLPIP